MKAMVYHTYGSPDVLKLEEVQRPTPKDNEILVKVQAAATAAGDWRITINKQYSAQYFSIYTATLVCRYTGGG